MKSDVPAVFVVVAMLFASPAFVAAASDVAAAEDTYVDPNLATRTRCLDHPGRPGWMMVHSFEYAWRGKLASVYRSMKILEAVASAGVCDCDKLHPDWNAHREALEAIWDGVSEKSRWVWGEAETNRYHEAYDALSKPASRLRPEVTRLCASVR